MVKQEVLDKVRAVDGDKEFVDYLIKLDTPEDIQNAFKEKGVDLSLDEVEELVVEMVDAAGKYGELSEEDLDSVSGGFVITSTVAGMAIFLGLTAIGVGIGWKAAAGKCNNRRKK